MRNHDARESGLPKIGRSELILTATWFGLLSGCADIVCRALEARFYLPVASTLQQVWMAPLASVAAFTGIAVLLLALFETVPSVATLRVSAFIFALAGFDSVLSDVFNTVYFLAPLGPAKEPNAGILLLSAGLAVQTSRFISLRPRVFYAQARRTIAGVLAVVLACTVGLQVWQGAPQRPAPRLAAGAPNVLLITLDTVRADHLSLYGYPRETSPRLRRLAEQGVWFQHAYATAPWTLPSHASMFTGHFPSEVSADFFAPLDKRFPTLAEVLRDQGYRTAGFVGNEFYCHSMYGLDRGFMHYEDVPVSVDEMCLSFSLGRMLGGSLWTRQIFGGCRRFGARSAAAVNREFLNWLGQNGQQPFFAFLNYFDAHAPYLPPAPFDQKFAPRSPALRCQVMKAESLWFQPNRKMLSPQLVELETDAYDSSISYVDDELGRLLDELESRKLLYDTLLIVASDHGEHLGEHGGLTGHGNSLFDPLLHVPFLMSWPSRLPSHIPVGQTVSLRDIPATVLDVLRLKTDVRFPGSSLAPFWEPNLHAAGEIARSELSDMYPSQRPAEYYEPTSLMAESMHFIQGLNGKEYLYDQANDPRELTDLADTPRGRGTILWLKRHSGWAAVKQVTQFKE